MNITSGTVRAHPDSRFAIIASRWNPRIVDALVDGAERALLEHGVAADAIDLIRVPGAWEIPMTAAKLAAAGAHAAILALGCVVRGETRHYEHVADGCAEGLMRVANEFRMPVLNGVLAVERHADAEARGWQARQQGRGSRACCAGNDRPLEKPVNHPHRPEGVDLAARSRSRRRALQAIYAWQVGGNRMAQVIEQFRHEQDMEIADLEYFEDLLRGIEKHLAGLDAGIRTHIDREVEEVDPIERAALRIAAYELRHRPDVPYRVVINEALEVTKRFGADQGHTYVNGVLDKLAAEWREVEYRGKVR